MFYVAENPLLLELVLYAVELLVLALQLWSKKPSIIVASPEGYGNQ